MGSLNRNLLVVVGVCAALVGGGSGRAVPAAESPTAVAVGVPPVPGAVVRTFDPPATRYGAGHRGVDLRARGGEPVSAALGGVVTFAGEVAGVGWVTVDHGAGLDTTYGPLDPRLVSAGSRVDAGAVLGALRADARWLDWGARRHGEYIDPLTLLGRWEVHLTGPLEDPPPLGVVFSAAGLASGGGGAGSLQRPVDGPVTSGFGPRVHPVSGVSRPHTGLDIGAASGTPVRTAASGRVTFAGAAGGYGLLVVVDHGGGRTTRYAHLSHIGVGVGAPLRAGAVIGRVGATGVSTGPHLHFEVRIGGVPTDPAGWLRSPIP